jgi:uncharacterized protein (UPF0332 family)
MTGPNRERNASAELSRAEECLREAKALQSAGLPYGATSRAYYAIFHAARALLFSLGLEVKGHRGALSLLSEHFVKAGRLSPEMGRLAAHMQRDREDADYDPGTLVTEAHARKSVIDAESFLAEARALLSAP